MKKIKISLAIIVILLSIFCIANISLAQNDECDGECNEVEFQREKGLIYRVLNYNLGYLAICVGIILLLGGFFYVFDIRPMQRKVDEQEKNVGRLIRENEEKLLDLIKAQNEDFGKLKSAIEGKLNSMMVEIWDRLDNLEDKNKKLEDQVKSELDTEIKKLKTATDIFAKRANDKIENLELSTIWDSHHMWEARKVLINVLFVLVQYLEKGIKYSKTSLFDICLKSIDETLDKIRPDSYDTYYHDRLIGVIKEIKGFEKEKEKILRKATKKLEEFKKSKE